MEEWVALKLEVLKSEGLNSLKCDDLWPRMLVSFGDEFPSVLRLAAILLLFVLDTSECERIFSLMNNVKCKSRSRLGPATLRNLMMWHYHGSKLKPSELPWLSILKEFRLLAGPRGRTTHRRFVNPAAAPAAAASSSENAPAAAGPAYSPAAASSSSGPARNCDLNHF